MANVGRNGTHIWQPRLPLAGLVDHFDQMLNLSFRPPELFLQPDYAVAEVLKRVLKAMKESFLDLIRDHVLQG